MTKIQVFVAYYKDNNVERFLFSTAVKISFFISSADLENFKFSGNIISDALWALIKPSFAETNSLYIFNI